MSKSPPSKDLDARAVAGILHKKGHKPVPIEQMRVAESDDHQQEKRTRDRKRTINELKLALHRLQLEGKKISIKLVADEAGVTPALLHNRYPDFAEEVRRIIGRATRDQRDEMHSLLQKEREMKRKLRELVNRQLVEITKLASVNESLRAELELQRAIAAGKVVRGQFNSNKDDV